ncbi:hypothetical protein H311_04696 [Anncaliia algerae PRA109]|nr:hypothetical protein H311_04696 [Anncaliia algerae PRA109]
MTTDLTTILEKVIHSTLRKKEIRDITLRIMDKMNILSCKPNTKSKEDVKVAYNYVNSNFTHKESNYPIQDLKNEYYKLKAEIGFI